MKNLYEGDYVEIYVGFSVTANGFNTNNGYIFANDKIDFLLPSDTNTYVGLPIVLQESDYYNCSVTGTELVSLL